MLHLFFHRINAATIFFTTASYQIFFLHVICSIILALAEILDVWKIAGFLSSISHICLIQV
jgi:hypothetical protein